MFRGAKPAEEEKWDQNALIKQIPDGKKLIGDSGLKGEPEKVTVTRHADSEGLKDFKARAKARQETFNKRIKDFQILDCTFRHGVDRHGAAFESVCVIVQYDLEHGHPLFEI